MSKEKEELKLTKKETVELLGYLSLATIATFTLMSLIFFVLIKFGNFFVK